MSRCVKNSLRYRHWLLPIPIVEPRANAGRLGKVLDRLKVALTEELIVEDAVRKGEAVALLLPQENLVNDCRRHRLLRGRLSLPGLLLVGLLLPGVSVHLKELGDLRGGDPAPEGLSRGITGDDGDVQIGEAVGGLGWRREYCNKM